MSGLLNGSRFGFREVLISAFGLIVAGAFLYVVHALADLPSQLETLQKGVQDLRVEFQRAEAAADARFQQDITELRAADIAIVKRLDKLESGSGQSDIIRRLDGYDRSLSEMNLKLDRLSDNLTMLTIQSGIATHGNGDGSSPFRPPRQEQR